MFLTFPISNMIPVYHQPSPYHKIQDGGHTSLLLSASQT